LRHGGFKHKLHTWCVIYESYRSIYSRLKSPYGYTTAENMLLTTRSCSIEIKLLLQARWSLIIHHPDYVSSFYLGRWFHKYTVWLTACHTTCTLSPVHKLFCCLKFRVTTVAVGEFLFRHQ